MHSHNFTYNTTSTKTFNSPQLTKHIHSYSPLKHKLFKNKIIISIIKLQMSSSRKSTCSRIWVTQMVIIYCYMSECSNMSLPFRSLFPRTLNLYLLFILKNKKKINIFNSLTKWFYHIIMTLNLKILIIGGCI